MNPTPDERGGLVSASGFDRIVQCPASVAAEREAVATGAWNGQVAEVAESGTRIHDAILMGELEHLGTSEGAIAGKLKQMEGEAVDQWLKEVKNK